MGMACGSSIVQQTAVQRQQNCDADRDRDRDRDVTVMTVRMMDDDTNLAAIIIHRKKSVIIRFHFFCKDGV